MDRRILFVVMPWHLLHYPSLGVGILSSIVRDHAADRPWGVETLYANIRWAEFLDERTGGRIGPDKHKLLGEDLFFQAVGEWVFTSALYDEPEWRVDAYREQFRGLDKQFDEIVASGIQIVGLTSVFQQNVPCLSLAKRLKRKAPDIKILISRS